MAGQRQMCAYLVGNPGPHHGQHQGPVRPNLQRPDGGRRLQDTVAPARPNNPGPSPRQRYIDDKRTVHPSLDQSQVLFFDLATSECSAHAPIDAGLRAGKKQSGSVAVDTVENSARPIGGKTGLSPF